jgi:hypothetical protein
VTVHGIVGCIRSNEGDGDTSMEMLLDPGQAKYLTPGSQVWACGSDQGSDSAPRLHLEIIPQHCRVREDNCADLFPYKGPKIPSNGEHVTVTGAWVVDTSSNRGYTHWAEIHPVFRMRRG